MHTSAVTHLGGIKATKMVIGTNINCCGGEGCWNNAHGHGSRYLSLDVCSVGMRVGGEAKKRPRVRRACDGAGGGYKLVEWSRLSCR